MSIVKDFTISVFRDSPDWYAALGNPELPGAAAGKENGQTNLDDCATHPKHDSHISCERSRWRFQHITLLHTSIL